MFQFSHERDFSSLCLSPGKTLNPHPGRDGIGNGDLFPYGSLPSCEDRVVGGRSWREVGDGWTFPTPWVPLGLFHQEDRPNDYPGRDGSGSRSGETVRP